MKLSASAAGTRGSGRLPVLITCAVAALCMAVLAPATASADWKAFNFGANFYNEYGWCQAYGKPATATAATPGGCQGQAAYGPSPWTKGARLGMDWSADYRNQLGIVKTLRVTSNGGTAPATFQGFINNPQWEYDYVTQGSIPGYPTVATGMDYKQHPGWYGGALSMDMEYHQQWWTPKTSGYSIEMQGWFGTP